MSGYAIEVEHVTKTYKLYENNRRRIIESLFPKAKPQYKGRLSALSEKTAAENLLC